MSKFNEIINSCKELLKSNLTAENTDMITKIDAELDKIVSAHEETEGKLEQTQNKLLEVVKNTSFKKEPESDIGDTPEDKPVSLDEAFDLGLKEIEEKRRAK